MEQLRDIRGLDTISWWPLAPGWWVLAGVVFLLLMGIIIWMVKRYRYTPSFEALALAQLNTFHGQLEEDTAREILAELSEWMRRIALQYTPRTECASLTGEPWLAWLQEHDPNGFDWTQHGTLLVIERYAPPGTSIELDEVKRLITAAISWVK